MKILISGICGHMGRELAKLALSGFRGAELICGVDRTFDGSLAVPCYTSFDDVKDNVDCIIDFSNHALTSELTAYAVKKRIPLVIATTGQTEEEKKLIYEASRQIPLFFAANYSLGIALLIGFAKKLAVMMPTAEIEIIEKHHNRKIDAPSGTAIAIADAICSVRPEMTKNPGRSGYGKRSPNEIGIHSVRLTNVVGEHEVIVATENETITLKHEAHDRKLFAEGALAAAEFICALPSGAAGLYDMKNLI